MSEVFVSDQLDILKKTTVKQLSGHGVSNIDHDKLDDYVSYIGSMAFNKDATLVSGTDESNWK